jgi:hypothetical protein
MTMKSIGRGLILLVGTTWLAACGPKAMGEPPPQNPGTVPTALDAALPVVPLSGRGVIVPSDVKLETPPKPLTSPSGPTPPPPNPGGT